MAFDCLLFDWDGTLVKTLDNWLEVYKEMCVKYGADISNMNDLDIVEASFGLWAKGLSNLGIREADKAYSEALVLVEEKARNVELYEDAVELLKTLKDEGKKLALHSSSYRKLLAPPLKKYQLEPYFEIILAREDYEKGKPDPEVLLKEIDFLKANKDTTLVIGDSDTDIKAGKAAGITTVLFYPENNEKFYRPKFLMKENPDYVISELSDLIKIADEDSNFRGVSL